jgi:hypothetical protein
MAQSKLAFLDTLDKEQLEYAAMVARTAKAAGVPPALAIAVAYKESSLRPEIKDGDAGEIGLMQVMPKTGKGMGYSEKDLRDTKKNIEAGVQYLKEGLTASNNDPMLTAAYYNGGPETLSTLAAGQKLDPRVKSYIQALKGYGTFEAIEPIEPSGAPAEPPKPPVNVNEPTAAQLAQMKLDKEVAEARETASEQKPFGAALGAGAGAGLATAKSVRDVKQGLGQLVEQLGQQGSQMGPTAPQAALGGAPAPAATPTPPQAGGLPSGTNAQTTRILQGTTGDQGTTGRARMTGFNVETSQQAAAKAEAERIAQMLRQTGQVTQEAPQFFAQQAGMTSTPSGVLAPRSDVPQYLGPRGPQGEIGGVKPVKPVVPKMSGLDATKELFVNMMKSAGNVGPTVEELKGMASGVGRAMGRFPYVSLPLAGADIGSQIPEIDYGLRVSQPDYTDVGLTGLGVLGTAAAFYPPVAPLAIPTAIAAPMIRDIRRQKQEIERNPAEYRDVIMKSLSNTDPMGNPIQ